MTTTSDISSLPPTQARRPAGVLLTREGADALAAELGRLREKLQVEFADRLRETRGFGDFHNNDDYLQAREEEAVIESRMRQLDALLRSAQIVDAEDQGDGSACVGSLVRVRDRVTGKTREHRLVGGFETYGEGYVSVNSPVGQALLGKRTGDRVAVDLPTGKSLDLEIVAIHY